MAEYLFKLFLLIFSDLKLHRGYFLRLPTIQILEISLARCCLIIVLVSSFSIIEFKNFNCTQGKEREIIFKSET